MKKLSVFFFLIYISMTAQEISVVENTSVTQTDEGKYFYPTLSPDGENLLFSSADRRGLWLKNLSTGKISKITDAAGAGYDPGFNENEIIYREDVFVSGRRKSSLYSYNPINGKQSQIENNIRDLKISRNSLWKCYLYVKESSVHPINNSLKKSEDIQPSVFIENSKIILFENGRKKELMPLGEGNYIWPSVSPQGDKLLFTKAGEGSYVSDLYGNIIVELGRADYSSWSPDGKWIVYMEDYDDGKRITKSYINVIKADGSGKQRLTTEEEGISVYPKWGNSNTEIFYNTENGQVRKLKLKFD